ncbi:MAG: exodeoxyribonuclease VII large subunit [Akkermansiaceae bacterium]|nr:exodeoxyribonuclease VII large subunit [Akkermansiaceae bacterium]
MAMTVSQLVGALRRAVEIDVGEQTVEGEIGSCKIAASGHAYFTVKDAAAQLDCVMYRSQALFAGRALREGVKVELRGKATVYEGRGRLQFLVTQVREAGRGELQARFEALKHKLEAEGLFSAARKRPIPKYAAAVGLITSPVGAVIQDMRHVFERRAPWVKVYLLPVQVQGAGAEEDIAAAIRAWNHPEENGLPPVDYLIVARGGGSLEDLWCFNEETLARAIAGSRLPVISAVGHETDFTISDFAADLRAPTPTAAVELGTPDGPALDVMMLETARRLRRRLEQAKEYARMRLQLAGRSVWKSPEELLQPWWQKTDELHADLAAAAAAACEAAHTRLEHLGLRLLSKHPREAGRLVLGRLDALGSGLREIMTRRMQALRASLGMFETHLRAAGPEETLRRGYALVLGAGGGIVRSAAQAAPGDEVVLRLADGDLRAEVTGSGAPRSGKSAPRR